MAWGRHSAALVSIAVIAAGLSACGGAEAGTSESATTPTASGAPLPGATATTMTVGVVAADIEALNPINTLQFRDPRFPGLSAAQAAALLPPSTELGGRTVTVNSTPFAPKNVVEAPDEPVQAICTAQKSSAIVITDVPNRPLIDCLVKNGSVVIDASTTVWDTTALNERAPLLWASATAAADTAENVLLAQAAQRNALPQGKATVIRGADDVTRRVADQITIPTLTAAGLAVTSLDEFEEAQGGFGRGPAVQELLSTDPSLVRPMTALDYGTLTGFAQPQAEDPQTPRILITSNTNPSFASGNAFVGAASQGLGWSPFRDGTSPGSDPQASSAAASQDCAATYPSVDFSDRSTNARSFLYRWCDAVNLLRIGTAPTGALTDAAFRDAVWSSGSAWNPAAVFANGWTSNTYTGANQARWLTGTEACEQGLGLCFTYAEGTIPLA